MSEQTTSELPRIALVFGDASAAAHLRDALVDHAEIVYAAPADEFDASRMSNARAAVALVNLDDEGWLGEIETELDASGVTLVFNDPEISRNLQGWERARWLRHLLAKLRGSSDVDPPRPETVPQVARPMPANADATPEISAPPADDAVAERPLSPEEIETMTADFVAAQEASPELTVVPAPTASAVPEAAQNANPLPAVDLDFVDKPMAFPAQETEMELDASTSLPMMAAVSESAASSSEPENADIDTEDVLDADTEALSAMIDARLKESEASLPSESPQVWRVVTGGAVSPVQLDAVIEADTAAGEAPSNIAHADAPAPANQDDADVLASLPSLDDWQLVDLEAATAPTVANQTRTSPEPVLSDAFAGLKLVPMDTTAPVEVQTDPVDRWFGGAPRPQADPNSSTTQSAAKETTHGRG